MKDQNQLRRSHSKNPNQKPSRAEAIKMEQQRVANNASNLIVQYEQNHKDEILKMEIEHAAQIVKWKRKFRYANWVIIFLAVVISALTFYILVP